MLTLVSTILYGNDEAIRLFVVVVRLFMVIETGKIGIDIEQAR